LDPGWPEFVRQTQARTPARLLQGRVGACYRTATQLDLRRDHAAARDAVRTELDIAKQLGAEFVHKWRLFEVATQAASKDQYLLDPRLGRTFSDSARRELMEHCSTDLDLQIAIGDGLSVAAIESQVPHLLPLLCEGAAAQAWSVGRSFVIRHCRVGILNEIGELLRPGVIVLLIGERPGLATAESLSAYLAYRPNRSHTDADRNLVSNIHRRGVSHQAAAQQILSLAANMMACGLSGTKLKPGPDLLSVNSGS
jgi:ethanolamine ammonia-lyase small subunit